MIQYWNFITRNIPRQAENSWLQWEGFSKYYYLNVSSHSSKHSKMYQPLLICQWLVGLYQSSIPPFGAPLFCSFEYATFVNMCLNKQTPQSKQKNADSSQFTKKGKNFILNKSSVVCYIMSIPKSKIINDNAKEIEGFIKAIIRIFFLAIA